MSTGMKKRLELEWKTFTDPNAWERRWPYTDIDPSETFHVLCVDRPDPASAATPTPSSRQKPITAAASATDQPSTSTSPVWTIWMCGASDSAVFRDSVVRFEVLFPKDYPFKPFRFIMRFFDRSLGGMSEMDPATLIDGKIPQLPEPKDPLMCNARVNHCCWDNGLHWTPAATVYSTLMKLMRAQVLTEQQSNTLNQKQQKSSTTTTSDLTRDRCENDDPKVEPTVESRWTGETFCAGALPQSIPTYAPTLAGQPWVEKYARHKNRKLLFVCLFVCVLCCESAPVRPSVRQSNNNKSI